MSDPYRTIGRITFSNESAPALPSNGVHWSVALEQRDMELHKLRALLRECLPAISGHLRDKVMQQLGSE